MTIIAKDLINGVEILIIENDHLKVSIIPKLGGKLLSVFNKKLKKEFVWINKQLPLKTNMPGADYDSNFIGGIDELIPNDQPENIDGINYPDHGELWTTPLQYEIVNNQIKLHGSLPLCQLYYTKTIQLEEDRPVISLNYSIKNESNKLRYFLWKLHAALRIKPGDKLLTSAINGQVVDINYSRYKTLQPFKWPLIENTDAGLVPIKNNSTDFFYLYDIPTGNMMLQSADEDQLFCYSYDTKVFPYQWYFASYGGFLNHYTAILEPCTNMPMSVNDAIEKNQSSMLKPGETLNTQVQIFAGKKKQFIKS